MTEETKSKIHPLMAGAAVAVIIACGVAVAAVTGNLPGSNAQKAEPIAPQATPAAPAKTPSANTKPTQVASAPTVAQAKARCMECGVVTDVRIVEEKGQGSGIGAVAGGVVGAVVGHEVVDGKNQGLATVAGGVAGAVAGHEIEKYNKTKKTHNVSVKMEDGSTKTIAYAEPTAWKPGDRVKVSGTKLERIQ